MSYIKRFWNIVANRYTFVFLLLAFTFVFWFYQKSYVSSDIIFLPDEYFSKKMIEDIEFAKKSIFISIYIFKPDDGDARELKESLIRAANRGVKVYLVMDVAIDDITSEVNKNTGKDLEKHGISVEYDSPLRKLHSKLTVIDEEIVYIGSHNYTNSAFSKNNESSVRIKSKKIAKQTIDYIKNIKTYEN